LYNETLLQRKTFSFKLHVGRVGLTAINVDLIVPNVIEPF